MASKVTAWRGGGGCGACGKRPDKSLASVAEGIRAEVNGQGLCLGPRRGSCQWKWTGLALMGPGGSGRRPLRPLQAPARASAAEHIFARKGAASGCADGRTQWSLCVQGLSPTAWRCQRRGLLQPPQQQETVAPWPAALVRLLVWLQRGILHRSLWGRPGLQSEPEEPPDAASPRQMEQPRYRAGGWGGLAPQFRRTQRPQREKKPSKLGGSWDFRGGSWPKEGGAW